MTSGGVGRHASHTAVRLVLEHIEHEVGAAAVQEVLRQAGETRPLADMLDDAGWSSYDRFRALLEAAGTMLGGHEHLRRIGADANLTGGSMPSATEMLQGLGSPAVLFGELGKGHASLITFLDIDAWESGTNEWTIAYRNRPGFPAYPAFCSFSAGVYPLTPRLFGYEPTDVVEETCQTRGDDRCRFRVGWVEGDEEVRRRITLEQRVELLERRLETFQATVSELVLAEDLGAALDRVVTAASRAIRAPGFILAVEPLAGSPRRIFSDGLPEAEAERLGARILAGEPCPEIGDLVVDISSSRRHYGRLAAYDPDGVILAEGSLLHAYARLAATALDSATAVEGTRREAARARALLGLSASLAEITTTEAMAFSLAKAVPAIVGADAATVSLVDHERQVVRITSAWGHPPDVEATLIGSELPVTEGMPEAVRYIVRADADEYVAPLMDAAGAVANVVMPIIVDGRAEGWLTTTVFDDPTRLAPDEELEIRLLGLAAQASTALRNARLVEQIRYQALHDSLTGLPNRTLILDRAEQMLARSRREGTPMTALFLDLDGFKEINDTLGHATGDRLLRLVAGRLVTTVRESDTLARLGGDEFIVLVASDTVDPGAGLVAQRILDVLREPFELEGRELTITASIGIAPAAKGSTAGDLLRDADIALYRAKAAGKNRAVVFAPEMQAAVQDRVDLETDLRSALEGDELFLDYQPVFELGTGEVTGVEALVRWERPGHGVVQPGMFVCVLEETGLIEEVGAWVLEEACRQAASWRSRGRPLDMSVNVSARQLESDRLVADVRRALVRSGLPATSLIVEITETTIMREASSTVRRLNDLKALGVRLAVDDFGTGYSSLAYLQQFPVDTLKIDRSFVSALSDSSDARALIHALVQLGKALGLSTLAEGIEEQVELDVLREEGCDSGQGFLVARPLSPSALEQLLGIGR